MNEKATTLELTSIELSAIMIAVHSAESRKGPYETTIVSAIYRLKAALMEAEFQRDHAYCDVGDSSIDDEFNASIPSDMPLMQRDMCSNPGKHKWTPEQWLELAPIELTKA